jgi:hypothetical protein
VCAGVAKNNGRRRGVQRYKCTACLKTFQEARRPSGVAQKIQGAYVHKKQTLTELSQVYKHSVPWIRKQLDSVSFTKRELVPQPTVILADTTFWGRSYGVTVFRSPTLKRNLWWAQVTGERMITYRYGREILEEQGWTFLAAVVDGRRGLTTVFKGIPVQICQFHQMKMVTKYITRRPKTPEGQALRALTLTLAKATEKDFTKGLAQWKAAYPHILTDKTSITGTNRWYYTHKNVRSAYMSLERNLPYLFTYQKYPELNIPNTTNSIDGFFGGLKKKVAVHAGLRRDRRYKLISLLLDGE